MKNKKTKEKDNKHIDELGDVTVIDHLLIIDEETSKVLVNKRG
jgi:hypothetical protein